MCEFVAKAGRVGVFTLPWCRHIHFALYQTGRGKGTETCRVNYVPKYDPMFSALVLKLTYVIYILYILLSLQLTHLPGMFLSPDLQLRIMDPMLEYMDFHFV